MNDNLAIPSLSQSVPASAGKSICASEQINQDSQIELLQRLPLQYKLSVGAVNDPLEYEADTVADRVMRMPEPNFIQRKCAHCEEEESIQRKPLASFIQRKESSAGNIISDAISNSINSSKGNGNGMDADTRSFMESRFGADLSPVKIHTNSEAVQMNRELSSRAFTLGTDIYFNEREYQPGTSEGKHLLAHELTHTIQQGSSTGNISRKTNEESPAPAVTPSGLPDDEIKFIANEVRKASKGLGTNEERIYRALQKLNLQKENIDKLDAAYKSMYGMSIKKQLEDELSGEEKEFAFELIGLHDKNQKQLIITLPQTDEDFKKAAKRLRAAMKDSWFFGLGTNEEAIFGVLFPFNRDPAKLGHLKQVYRDIYGSVLKKDIEGEMSCSELAYALFLLNENESGVVEGMEAMMSSTIRWRSSLFLPCKNGKMMKLDGTPAMENGVELLCTTFAEWASSGNKSTPPPATTQTVLNCWEAILLAGYNVGAISWDYIHEMYTVIPQPASCKRTENNPVVIEEKCRTDTTEQWVSKLTTGDAIAYDVTNPKGRKPKKGDIVFFNSLEHVALATGKTIGNETEVLSFWPPSDIRNGLRSADGTIPGSVVKTTIEQLAKGWKLTDKSTDLKSIEFRKPNW